MCSSDLFAPTGTPQPILDRLGDAFAKVIRSPELIEQYRRSGTDAVGNSPAEFAAFVKAETGRWGRLVMLSGAQAARLAEQRLANTGRG